ncbi:hypothetical protein PYCC9005_000511 [Savitreella phatthalungensis]
MSYSAVPTQEPPTYSAPPGPPNKNNAPVNAPSYGSFDAGQREFSRSAGAVDPNAVNPDDDFKFGTSVASCEADVRMGFLRKVYSILTAQIIATSIVGAVMHGNDSVRYWVQSNSWAMITAMIATFASLFALFYYRQRYPLNFYLLGGFTLLEAYTVGTAVSFYESQIVLEALLITSAVFVALTLFTLQTKYDFTSLGGYLYMGLWALIVTGFVGALFPHGKTFELVYSGLGTLLFSGYVLYDTQQICRHYSVDEYIAASVSLYLDFLNLFLNILRLLNSANSDN